MPRFNASAYNRFANSLFVAGSMDGMEGMSEI
jgi:hypothetical protein